MHTSRKITNCNYICKLFRRGEYQSEEEAVSLFGIYYKFVVYAAFFVVEHF